MAFSAAHASKVTPPTSAWNHLPCDSLHAQGAHTHPVSPSSPSYFPLLFRVGLFTLQSS